jgi:hypothetical protein
MAKEKSQSSKSVKVKKDNKEKLKLEVEPLLEQVCKSLKALIENNATNFIKQGDFKIKSGFGFEKYYLNDIGQLNYLIHHILYFEGHYKRGISESALKELELVMKETPDLICRPHGMRQIQDIIFTEATKFVGRELIKLGFDVRRNFRFVFDKEENDQLKELKLTNLKDMVVKSELPSYELILKVVCKTLKEIINDNSPYFKEEGSFKVRPGFGYDKFYLDWVDGSYDMSLQSLVHYIMYEKGLYKMFLSQGQMEDLEKVIKEYPDSIYSPSDNDVNYEAVQYDILDPVYSECIRFVGRELIKKGFDVRKQFSSYLDEEELEQLKNKKLINIEDKPRMFRNPLTGELKPFTKRSRK